MRIIEMVKDVKTENFYHTILEATKGERFDKRDKIFIEGERYIVKESQEIEYGKIPKLYKVLLKHTPQTTKYNYDTVDFIHVYNVERTDVDKFEIRQPSVTSEYPFDSPEECLKEFIAVKKMHKEALSSGEE